LTATQNGGESFKTTSNTTTAESAAETAPLTTIYQSNVDGFRIGVADGWVVEDPDNNQPSSQILARQLGFGSLADLCPQSQALRDVNGTYYCLPEVSAAIRILRFSELQTRPEFTTAGVQENINNRTITISDFVSFLTQFVEKFFGFKNLQIANTSDTTVNVIDPQTNQTVATAPARYVIYTFTAIDESGREVEGTEIPLAVLNNDTNTGYVLAPTFPPQSSMIENKSPRQIVRQMDQMSNSFELLATNATTIGTPDDQLMMR
jgi:hypothetical protein